MSTESAQLLYSGYQYGPTIKLDLYGLPATEDEGYLVTSATLVGSKLSLAYLLNDSTLDQMGRWLDERSDRDYRDDSAEARDERRAYERQMSRLDHLWRSL